MRQLLKRNKIYKWLNFNQKLTISCLLCRGKTLLSQPLCPLCLSSCPTIDHSCRSCGIPMDHLSTNICASCIQKTPDFDICYSAFIYAFPVNHIVQRIKYRRDLSLLPPITRSLTHIMTNQYNGQPWPEAVIPVPLHRKKLRSRGYDQALLLAREITRQLKPAHKLNLDTQLIKRVKATDPQQGLSARERKKNIRGAFQLRRDNHYKHVALVDDVVTTGSTVNEIARLLKKTGTEKIEVWCLARTPVGR